MNYSKNIIFEHYEKINEDMRLERTKGSMLEAHYTKKHLSPYITKSCDILELGCATGYYGMYFADKCASYLGIDFYAPHIELFCEKVKDSGIENVSAKVGDATDLREIPDDSFDVVLCLGPMYHLPKTRWGECFSECRRICKNGGIAAFAYINKVGLYAGACESDPDYYPNEKTNEYVLKFGTDDEAPGVFYFTMPEEIEQSALKYGFVKEKNLATDFFFDLGGISSADDKKMKLYMPLLDNMTAYESCTGMANHALLICKNNKG